MVAFLLMKFEEELKAKPKLKKNNKTIDWYFSNIRPPIKVRRVSNFGAKCIRKGFVM